jgi:hypothetical protein
MNDLHVFMLHRIVGGLKLGALPHEEWVWCAVLPGADDHVSMSAAQRDREADPSAQENSPAEAG